MSDAERASEDGAVEEGGGLLVGGVARVGDDDEFAGGDEGVSLAAPVGGDEAVVLAPDEGDRHGEFGYVVEEGDGPLADAEELAEGDLAGAGGSGDLVVVVNDGVVVVGAAREFAGAAPGDEGGAERPGQADDALGRQVEVDAVEGVNLAGEAARVYENEVADLLRVGEGVAARDEAAHRVTEQGESVKADFLPPRFQRVHPPRLRFMAGADGGGGTIREAPAEEVYGVEGVILGEGVEVLGEDAEAAAVPVQHDEGRLGAVTDDEGVQAVVARLDHAALIGRLHDGEDAPLSLVKALGRGGGGQELQQAHHSGERDGRNANPAGERSFCHWV